MIMPMQLNPGLVALVSQDCQAVTAARASAADGTVSDLCQVVRFAAQVHCEKRHQLNLYHIPSDLKKS